MDVFIEMTDLRAEQFPITTKREVIHFIPRSRMIENLRKTITAQKRMQVEIQLYLQTIRQLFRIKSSRNFTKEKKSLPLIFFSFDK